MFYEEVNKYNLFMSSGSVRFLKNNNINLENNIKMSNKYCQNLAQNKCIAGYCKRGNIRNIIHLFTMNNLLLGFLKELYSSRHIEVVATYFR
jgi:hypothetical protein